jgi:hypothetical protein
MKESKCADCSMKSRYDINPNSIISRIWKWHLSWCPGWKAYLKSLPENEKTEVMKKYGQRK